MHTTNIARKKSIIKRAQAAKCHALVLTMDLPILAQRHQDIKNGLSAPPRLNLNHIIQLISRPKWCLNMLRTKNRYFGNIIGHAKGVDNLTTLMDWSHAQFDQSLSWEDVTWIKKLWKGPLIIKGILDEKDAIIAENLGVDGIIVSNHGGRQLDGTSSSIMVLDKIVNQVGKNLEVYFDGGIRSGQDIVKAISLGAKGVFMGRPYLYGLGSNGKQGVEKVLEILIIGFTASFTLLVIFVLDLDSRILFVAIAIALPIAVPLVLIRSKFISSIYFLIFFMRLSLHAQI